MTQREPPFVGRADLLAAVVGSEAPVTLLVGDSGIGKSEVLRRAQMAAHDSLAAEPVEVFASDGAIESAVLDAITSTLARLMVDDAWRAHRATGLNFLRRLIARTASGSRRAIGAAAISQLRKRLGDEAVDIAIEGWSEAAAAMDESILARAAALQGPNVLGELVALADELRALSGRRNVALALDRLEILPESAIRSLSDLARILPDGVLVRGALMNGSAQGMGLLETLRSTGGSAVHVLDVRPFDADATRSYVMAACLDPALGDDLLRLTGGYPLHLGDAVLHLNHGGAMYDLPVNRHFGWVIDRSWVTLDANVRRIARQLCLLELPLPLAAMLTAVGVAEPEWWDAAESLKRTRIFTQEVDGLPWFHEQRRRWLLEQLDPNEQRASAARLVGPVAGLLETPTGWRYATTLAGLVQTAGDELADDALRSLGGLPKASLAVAGALLELSEPKEPIVDAQSLLTHARSHFGVSGDLTAALGTLQQAGYAGVRASKTAAVAFAIISPAGAATVAGLCQLQLGRMPVPGLASVVWRSVLGPLAQPFDVAVVGVGRPRPGELASELRATEMRRTGIIGRPFAACVAYGSHRGTPIYAIAKKAPGNEVRLAAEWRDASSELAGGTFRVADVVEFPGERIPARRWSAVSDDLLGREGPSDLNGGPQFDVGVAILSALRESARDRMRRSELVACGWTESAHYYFSDERDHRLTIEVTGADPGATEIKIPRGWVINDPYFRLRLAELLQLPSQAHVGRISGNAGPRLKNPHPLREFAKNSEDLLLGFNRQRNRVEVSLAPGKLEAFLLPHLVRRYEDRLALWSTDPAGLPEPDPWEVFILTSPSPPSSVMGCAPAATAVRSSDRCGVHYCVASEPLANWGEQDLVRRWPEAKGLRFHGFADVTRAIANLGGFDAGDLSCYTSMKELRLRS